MGRVLEGISIEIGNKEQGLCWSALMVVDKEKGIKSL